jgi:ubiquinone/menaquinone biosynthesis C-methylase UbiE
MIVKVPNHIEGYRTVARYAKSVDRLGGYGDLSKIEPATRKLLQEIELKPEDILVDVGCGNGALVRMARPLCADAIGTAATEEEKQRLEETGMAVVAGLSDSLPLPDHFASLLVANSVLILVPRNKIAASLHEFRRITKPGGRIWIGSNALAMENQDVPRYRNAGEMLWFLLRKRGVRTFLGMSRRILVSQITKEPIVLNQAPHVEFYGPAEEFFGMAEAAGLKLIRWRQDANRYSSLFLRP